jgi:malate dehydrogenase (oxaloacetate-decarboxylating)
MCLAAAFEIARMAEEKGLSEEYIVPTMEEWDVYPREAAAAAYEACLEGLARKKTSKEIEYEYAKEIISIARRKFEQLKISGLIRRYKKI